MGGTGGGGCEMCLTDDAHPPLFAAITPTEGNYCRKQKLASASFDVSPAE